MSLSTDMSDEEIKDCIQQAIPVVTIKRQGFCLTISGHDDDYRELWNIPEAVEFMKRLCNLGFISVLEVSTTSPELVRKEYKLKTLPGFGALEIWMCATNRMEHGRNDIDRETIAKFHVDLKNSNKCAEKIMKEPPYKTRTNKSFDFQQTPDASIKHSGFKKRLI
jgi:hypothetical protein